MKLPSSLKRPSKPSPVKRTVFISKKMLPVAYDGQVDVVLSPAFYWFREKVLPAKNAQQAKKLAPSFFDAIIPEGHYEYMAVPHNETFWLFAYDPDMIAEVLADKGLKPAQVRAIYFAQLECKDLNHALKINDEQILVNNEGVVSVLPVRYGDAQESVESFCAKTPRSRHKVGISLFRSGVLDEKQLGRLTVVAIVFLAIYLVGFLQLRHQYKEQLVREYALKEHYKLPETSFQLKSLINSLEGKQKRQLAMRRVLKKLTKLPLEKGEALLRLSMKPKKAELSIRLSTPKRAEAIKTSLLQFARVSSAKVKDRTFYVSIAYE